MRITRLEIRIISFGSFVGQSGKIDPWDVDCSLDGAVDWCVPAVIILGAQVALINCASSELGGVRVPVEDVVKRVWLRFEPKLVVKLHVVCYVEHG